MDLYQHEFDYKKLNLIIDIDDDIPKIIYNDKQRFQTVLLILLGNSLKYTNSGFVRLKISRGCHLKAETAVASQN